MHCLLTRPGALVLRGQLLCPPSVSHVHSTGARTYAVKQHTQPRKHVCLAQLHLGSVVCSMLARLLVTMAQARPPLLEAILSRHRPLLAIFAFLPIQDRQALQASDFYLHADIRWFLLRAPPLQDARGAGTASDSSTSTRLSTASHSFAS